MIRFSHILVVILIAVSFSWLACKQEKDPCLQPKIVPIHIGIYQPADTGTLGKDSILPSAIVGLVDTPVAYYYGARANKFSIQLSPKLDSTRWFFIPDSSRKDNVDTLTFYYKRNVHFLSEACGFVYFYTLGNINSTHYFIDSVIISKYDVNSDANIEHVKIFY